MKSKKRAKSGVQDLSWTSIYSLNIYSMARAKSGPSTETAATKTTLAAAPKDRLKNNFRQQIEKITSANS